MEKVSSIFSCIVKKFCPIPSFVRNKIFLALFLTLPEVGFSIPVNKRNRVLFPLPFFPLKNTHYLQSHK
jgi:hypothetical protein